MYVTSSCFKVKEMCLWPDDCWRGTLDWPWATHRSYLLTHLNWDWTRTFLWYSYCPSLIPLLDLSTWSLWNLCQNRHFCISCLASVAVVHWQNRCCSYIWKKKLKLAEQVQLQFHKPHVCNLNLHAMSTEPQWAHSFSKCTAEHPLCSHICLS